MAGKGGGSWKVAYADFVTAMMAFFMLMWLTAQKPEVKEAVEALQLRRHVRRVLLRPPEFFDGNLPGHFATAELVE